MENEMRESDQPPDHIREYMENTEFKIQDTLGQEEVVLTRTFGDEKYGHSLSSSYDEPPIDLPSELK